MKSTISGPLQNILKFSQFTSSHLQEITHQVQEKGYVLIKGLNMSQQQFSQNFLPFVGNPLSYKLGATFRQKLADNLLDVGLVDPFVDLVQHHEMAYSENWPKYMAFTCFNPPFKGQGQTVVCSSEKMAQELPQELLNKFYDHGITYIRNMSSENNPRDKYFYNDWQKVFETKDPLEAEKMCDELGYEYLWDEKQNLQIKYTKPAFIKSNNREVFYNQALSFAIQFEFSKPYNEVKDKTKWPYYCTFGNGELISLKDLQIINEASNKHNMACDWETGDILCIDNEVYTHGRVSYDPKAQRNIGVMMGTEMKRIDPFQKNGCGNVQTIQN